MNIEQVRQMMVKGGVTEEDATKAVTKIQAYGCVDEQPENRIIITTQSFINDYNKVPMTKERFIEIAKSEGYGNYWTQQILQNMPEDFDLSTLAETPLRINLHKTKTYIMLCSMVGTTTPLDSDKEYVKESE